MKLTPKQKAFADYYIELGNATEAYKKAYKNKCSDNAARANGSKVLTKDYVKNYIEEKLKELEDERIAKADEVLKYLTRVLRKEESEPMVVEEKEPVIGEDGKKKGYRTTFKTIDTLPSIKDRNKAAELLGKRYRLFIDKIEADTNINSTAKLDSILEQLGEEDNE